MVGSMCLKVELVIVFVKSGKIVIICVLDEVDFVLWGKVGI